MKGAPALAARLGSALWLAIGSALVPAAAFAGEAGGLNPAEARGKEIYLHGTLPGGGAVVALVGEEDLEVPASALPCAGCHGRDGRGRPEGGVNPSDLTWEALTKPYGVDHPGGRRHPPYTEELVARAITEGLDPAGQRLHTAMPRYRLAADDVAALVAYLRRLGADPDPGLGESSIRIGALLPPATGPTAPLAAEIRSALTDCLADANARGGVYGRKIEFVPFALPADPAARPVAAGDFLDHEPIFALAPSFFVGADRELAALAADREVPTIAPFTRDPDEGFPLNRQVFYLVAGPTVQARALVAFAARRARPAGGDPPRAAVVVPAPAREGGGAGDPEVESVAEAVVADVRGRGWPEVVRAAYPSPGVDAAALAADLQRQGVTTIFLLGSGGDAAALLAAGAALGWIPDVLVPGAFAGGAGSGGELFAMPPACDGHLFLAVPTAPGDRNPAAIDRITSGGAGGAGGDGGRPPSGIRIAAWAGCELLLDGLGRAGRELSRERLIAALEGLYDHPTGLTPQLSYGPNRRIGARGAYVVAVDLANHSLVSQGGWVDVTEGR